MPAYMLGFNMNGTIALLEVEYAERISLIKIFTLLLLLSAMPFSYYCYQETATNTTSCGLVSDYPGSYLVNGTFAARQPGSSAYDANYLTYAQDADGGVVSYIYVDYYRPTRPSNETVDLASTLWQNKGGRVLPFLPDTVNSSFPSQCDYPYNSTVTFKLRIALNDEPAAGIGESYNYWSCYDAKTFGQYYVVNQRGGGTASDHARGYEEGLWWNIQPRSNLTLACGTGCANVTINNTTSNTSVLFDVPYLPLTNEPIRAEALPGYQFSNWSDDGGAYCTQASANNSNTTASLKKASCTITANFVSTTPSDDVSTPFVFIFAGILILFTAWRS